MVVGRPVRWLLISDSFIAGISVYSGAEEPVMGEISSSEFCCPASSVEGMGLMISVVSTDPEEGGIGSLSVHEAKHIIIEAAARSRAVNLNPLMRIYLLEGRRMKNVIPTVNIIIILYQKFDVNARAFCV